MDDPWKQLPRAAAIVYVGVLAAGSGRAVRAEQREAPPSNTASSSELPPDQIQTAPTCGPACHGGGEIDPVVVEPPLDEPDPVAPTCGPECHDGDYRKPDVEPPPIEERKQGCAVESADGDEPGLALLGLGLLAGVAARRRRDSP